MKVRTPIALGLRVLSRLATSVVLALTVGIGSAAADSIIYDLTLANISGFTGPFAEVTVTTLNSTTATIRFDSLQSGGYIYLMGDGSSVAVNVSGAFTLGSISGSNSLSGFSAPSYTNAHSANVAGYGVFNQTIKSFDGWSHSSTEISLGLTATGGNSWATAASVLTPNAKGQIAAIHFYACIPSGTGCANNSPGALSITGFASGATVVPIPAAAWLFGSGLIGLIAIARRSSLRKSFTVP